MTDDLKLKIYPAIIAILGLSLVALMLSRVEIQVARNPGGGNSGSGTVPLPPPAPPEIPTPTPSPAPVEATPPSPAPAPSPTVNLNPNPQGGLRVSNQTRYPIRVALLYQQASASAASDPTFGQPVHWDFAPAEGEAKGLILSLPGGDLRLRQGDVLVAFAQDGSRRYWGPYVVGKTQLPTWSSDQQEWLLPLR
ncbi:MAG: hypothetical protein ACKO7W_22390 [Elainella sp.]